MSLLSRLTGLPSRLDQLRAEADVPGAVVGVLDRDEMHVVASGVTSLDTSLPVTEDTVFQIGSNTKLYTATLVMQLVDTRHIALDELVATYVPELRLPDPSVLEQITVRHLLTHTSGLTGDHFGPRTDWGDDAIARFVESLAAVEQLHPVGAFWSYSNAGYCLLGRLIENVTGQPYPDALRSRLLDPLGVRTPLIRPNDIVPVRAAIGHQPGDDGALRVAPTYQILPSNMAAGTVAAATAADVLAFVRMHLADGRAADGRQVVSAASARQMMQPQVVLPMRMGTVHAWGIGWRIGDVAGQRLIGHGGGTIGGISKLEVLPDRNLAIVVLTNAPGGNSVGTTVVRELLEQLAGVQLPAAPEPPAEFQPVEAHRYVGTFKHGGGSIVVTTDDGQLSAVRYPVAPVAEMSHAPQRAALVPLSQADHFLFGATTARFLEPGPNGAMQYLFIGGGRLFRRASAED